MGKKRVIDSSVNKHIYDFFFFLFDFPINVEIHLIILSLRRHDVYKYEILFLCSWAIVYIIIFNKKSRQIPCRSSVGQIENIRRLKTSRGHRVVSSPCLFYNPRLHSIYDSSDDGVGGVFDPNFCRRTLLISINSPTSTCTSRVMFSSVAFYWFSVFVNWISSKSISPLFCICINYTTCSIILCLYIK